MVAKTVELPNVRKLFVADPGYVICEGDLSGADARVVAWEANDEQLMDAFDAGLAVHILNARTVFPEKVKGWSDEAIKATDKSGGLYHECKQGVHGSNYGAAPKTLAGILGWLVSEAEDFQRRWFGAHPGIRRWHRDVELQLARTRSVSNKFGYRIVYFDRANSILPQALAWIPQSTVAITCIQGGLQLKRMCPWVEILMQVHDSWLFQYPIGEDAPARRAQIAAAMAVSVPYDRPLRMPWGYKGSSRSWGVAVKKSF